MYPDESFSRKMQTTPTAIIAAEMPRVQPARRKLIGGNATEPASCPSAQCMPADAERLRKFTEGGATAFVVQAAFAGFSGVQVRAKIYWCATIIHPPSPANSNLVGGFVPLQVS